MATAPARVFENYPGFYPSQLTPTSQTPIPEIRKWLSTVVQFFRLFDPDQIGFLTPDKRHARVVSNRLEQFESWTRFPDEQLAAINKDGFLLYELGLSTQKGARSGLHSFLLHERRGPQVFNVLKTACQDLVLRPQDENYQLTSADRVLQHGLGIIDSYGGGWFANSLPLTVWERTRLIELAYEYMTRRMSDREFLHFRIVVATRVAQLWQEDGDVYAVRWRAAVLASGAVLKKQRKETSRQRTSSSMNRADDTPESEEYLSIQGRGGFSLAWTAAYEATCHLFTGATHFLAILMKDDELRRFEDQRDLLKWLGCLNSPELCFGHVSADSMKLVKTASPFTWLLCKESLVHPAIEYYHQRESGGPVNTDESKVTTIQASQHHARAQTWLELYPLQRALRLLDHRNDGLSETKSTIHAVHIVLQSWRLDTEVLKELLALTATSEKAHDYASHTISQTEHTLTNRRFLKPVFDHLLHALRTTRDSDEVHRLLMVVQTYDLSTLFRQMIHSAHILRLSDAKLETLFKVLNRDPDASLGFIERQIHQYEQITGTDHHLEISTFQAELAAQLKRIVRVWNNLDAVHRFGGMCLAYRLQSEMSKLENPSSSSRDMASSLSHACVLTKRKQRMYGMSSAVL